MGLGNAFFHNIFFCWHLGPARPAPNGIPGQIFGPFAIKPGCQQRAMDLESKCPLSHTAHCGGSKAASFKGNDHSGRDFAHSTARFYFERPWCTQVCTNWSWCCWTALGFGHCALENAIKFVLQLQENLYNFVPPNLPEDGVQFTSSTGLVVVDLVVGVGNFFEGFTQLCLKSNVASLYIPVFGDMEHREWFDQFWTSELCDQFQEGKLPVPGCERHMSYVVACSAMFCHLFECVIIPHTAKLQIPQKT